MYPRISPRRIGHNPSQCVAGAILLLATACTVDKGSSDRTLLDLPFDAEAQSTMVYACTDASEYGYQLQLFADGALRISDETGDSLDGTYSLSDEVITLSIPQARFEETAQAEEVALGVLGAFMTNSLYCHAIAFSGESSIPDEFFCPLSNHIQDVSYEEDELYLRDNGNVFWRHWDYLVEANDQLYSAHNGIWRQDGDRVTMFFGSPIAEHRVLTGTLRDGALHLDQFDTSNGPCEMGW